MRNATSAHVLHLPALSDAPVHRINHARDVAVGKIGSNRQADEQRRESTGHVERIACHAAEVGLSVYSGAIPRPEPDVSTVSDSFTHAVSRPSVLRYST